MFIVKTTQNETYSLPIKEIHPSAASALASPLANRILHSLAKEPSYPKAIAKKLQQHEQKIYYHIRRLEKAGFISVMRTEKVQGAQAVIYGLSSFAFSILFAELLPTQKISTQKEKNSFLDPFIVDGKLNAAIIVGSPDPHGPEKARSRDGYYGMDLALFLGTFLNYVPTSHVKLDTETRREDLKGNLIVIGGPIVNHVSEMLNDHLPIRFKDKKVYSTLSKRMYDSDETGIIVKAKNPFDAEKYVLVVAGLRHAGTKAAILAFLHSFDELVEGNRHNKRIQAKVVEGIDRDSDGVIDDVEIVE